MQENVKVCQAQLIDFETVWNLLQEYYSAVNVEVRDDEPSARKYIVEPSSGIWLAHFNEEAAGCIILRPHSSGTGEIKRLYVKPSYRRHGLAALLLATLEAYARQIGLRTLYLDSKDDLSEAIAFYHRAGYSDCDRYNANPQATVFMKKDLAEWL